MKNEKGITLVSLVITIILIIMLASISTYTGIESFQGMRTQAFVSKMITLQEKVDVFCDKYTVAEINDMGTTYGALSNSEAKSVLDSVISDGSNGKLKCWFDTDNIKNNYRFFTVKDIEEKIGLKNFDVGIWLNPNTRNVIAIEGIKDGNITYYRQYDLTGGQTLSAPVLNTTPAMEDTEYKLLTYDNKAVIKFTKQYETVTYTLTGGQSVSVSNVSEVELPYSGIYAITAKDDKKVEKRLDNISVSIVNKPMLVSGMVPVKPSGSTYVDININNEEEYQDWYNYYSSNNNAEISKKKWANARLQDGSIYVWIPRFAYKISGTTVNIKFLKEFSDVTTEGKVLETGYRVAPAFQNGVASGFANGEWENEITGFWVAKYEATNNSNIPKSIETTTAGWKVTANNAFLYCRQMETKTALFRPSGASTDPITTKVSGSLTNGSYQNDSNNIDTHLMKNSEWGAVTYLAYSSYGARAVNYQGGVYPGRDCGTNRERSTTGNMYGVYGMAGGNPEIIASGIDITAYNTSNTSNKYATKYPTNATTIVGDAIYNSEVSSWTSITRTFPTASAPIFLRGGTTSSGNMFIYQNQAAGTSNNFRPVIIIEY